jgi:hypothetical protein
MPNSPKNPEKWPMNPRIGLRGPQKAIKNPENAFKTVTKREEDDLSKIKGLRNALCN